MQLAVKYTIGQVFQSIRNEEDAFVISDRVSVGKSTVDKKGKTIPSKTFSYELSYIPEVLTHEMPSGDQWIHIRESFLTHDELIDKELALGNWILL